MSTKRDFLPPSAIRALGVELNGGRVHGWVDNLAPLIGTPAATIRGWAMPQTAGAHRPIPGAAAHLIILLALMQRRDISVSAMMEAIAGETERWIAGSALRE